MHNTNLLKYSNFQSNASEIATHSENQREMKRQPNTKGEEKKKIKKIIQTMILYK